VILPFFSAALVVKMRRPRPHNERKPDTMRLNRRPKTLKMTIAVACASVLLTACSMPKLSMPSFSLPRVHKLTVQQGNVLSQEMIDKLKPGMTRSQVAYIMGEPIFRNSFNESRWDYIYTIEVPGYFNEQVHVSLFFEQDLLAYFTGDFAPSSEQEGESTGATQVTAERGDAEPNTQTKDAG